MEEDLPFSPPIPKTKRKRKKRFPLIKAIADSAAEMSLRPLLDYARREWKSVKKYPGFLTFCVLLALGTAWYCTRWWYVERPYTGETNLKLFFPGDTSDQHPTEVSKTNIYRAAVMGAHMQATTPKDEKQVNVADVVFWQVNLIFDKEVDAENSVLEAKGLTSDITLEIREFNHRSAFITIIPSKPGGVPKGMLEVEVKHRTANYNMVTRPSPTPSTKASPH